MCPSSSSGMATIGTVVVLYGKYRRGMDKNQPPGGSISVHGSGTGTGTIDICFLLDSNPLRVINIKVSLIK